MDYAEQTEALTAMQQREDELYRSTIAFNRVGSGEPSGSLQQYVQNMLQEDDTLLDKVLPLRRARGPIMECLQGIGGYESMAVHIILRNDTKEPIRIPIGSVNVPRQTPKNQNGAYIKSPTWVTRFQYETIQPGDSITLPLHWAILAFEQYSRSAHHPLYWDAASVPQTDGLKEIGRTWSLMGSHQEWELDE